MPKWGNQNEWQRGIYIKAGGVSTRWKAMLHRVAVGLLGQTTTVQDTTNARQGGWDRPRCW